MPAHTMVVSQDSIFRQPQYIEVLAAMFNSPRAAAVFGVNNEGDWIVESSATAVQAVAADNTRDFLGDAFALYQVLA